jgi:outer membrane assembly lipoprotein YfiO
VVLGALAGLLAGCGAGVMPVVHSEQERLAQGRQALAAGEYNVAIEYLKTYVTNNAGGSDVDLAIDLLGQAYLHIKEWAEAQGQFERLLRDYPESDSAGSASYYLGEALWGQARGPDFDQEFTQKSLDQWTSYLASYPGHWQNDLGGKRVQKARERLAKKLADDGTLYLKLRDTRPARVYFQRVLDEYPGTPAAEEATLGLALADAQAGKRAEAIAALRDLESHHPGRDVAQRAAKELARLERHEPQKKK